MNISISNIISLIIIAGLVTLLGIQGCSKLTLKSELKKEKESHEILKGMWQKLISTPPKITTVVKTITVKGKDRIIPVPLPHDSPPATDSIPCPENKYRETYSIGDSIHATWYATTAGLIQEFGIEEITYPQRFTTIERYIPPLPCDTSAIIKMKVRSSHWGMWIGGTAFNLKEMPSPQAGLIWSFKDKWAIQPGAMYCTPLNRWGGSVNVIFYFR